MELPYARSQDKLRDCLEQATGKSVFLVITDNSTRVVSVRPGSRTVCVRLHWMFLHAGDDVVGEIAGFIRVRKGKTPLINRFIRENRHCLRERKPRPFKGRIQGSHFNLKELFDSLNQEYFCGRVSAKIGWGKKNSRRSVRKRTLGSYCRQSNVIRINPVLDRKNIPLYYIRYVVYHEMLHCEVGESADNGRRLVHSSEFRIREREFKEYHKARTWDKRH
ncbi:MAG: SprT-like domain-containing protein [Nitrospirota bacterium]